MRWTAACVCAAVLGVALVLGTVACGGGGGGGAPLLDEFSGTYFLQLYEGEVGPPLDDDAVWGTLTADGAGTVTGGFVTSNSAGTLSGPNPFPPFSYTIGAGRRITWSTPISVQGGISADGRVSALTSITAGSSPTAAILLRRAGTFSTASLSGTYHMCAFWTGSGTDATWWAGTIMFDGLGGVMASSGTNLGGTATPPGPPAATGTYTVAADGTVTWTLVPPLVLTGGMLAGGELVVLAGTTAATDGQYLVVLIQQGAGLTNATFNGGYHVIVTSASNTPPPRYASVTTTGTADGVGSLSLNTGTSNVDGTLGPSPAIPSTPYLVAPSGALGVGAGALQGAVSPSGDFAMMAGGTTTPSNPQFWFMHR